MIPEPHVIDFDVLVDRLDYGDTYEAEFAHAAIQQLRDADRAIDQRDKAIILLTCEINSLKAKLKKAS